MFAYIECIDRSEYANVPTRRINVNDISQEEINAKIYSLRESLNKWGFDIVLSEYEDEKETLI